MSSEDILDAAKLCYNGDFNNQLHNILLTVRLTRAQVESLQNLLDDLVWQLRLIWPDCTVFAFGSIVVGLGIKTSDIDCYIDTHTELPPRDCVLQARDVFKQYPNMFKKIFAITAAKVPIIKLFHVPTRFDCDINFSGHYSVLNSKLMTFLLHLDERALKLAIIIKYWSKVYGFTGTNLMPNYALSILVIFYLQYKNILPSICALQRGVESFIANNWNTAFNDKWQQPSGCNENLYELLGGFFKYYSTFNYADDMVSPFVGLRLKRKAFTCLTNVPNDFVLYKQNIESRACKPLRVDSFMCIQDTIEHNKNCTVAVYPRLAIKILSHFKFAAEVFETVDSKCFLKKLLTEDPTAIQNGPEHTNRKKVVKNNKGLFKKKFKDIFKNSKLDVNAIPKKKR